MFKLLKLKWQKELEEMSQLHRLQMKEKEADLVRVTKDKEQSIALLEKKLTTESDMKLRESIALLEMNAEQKEQTMTAKHKEELESVKREAKNEFIKLKDNLLSENFEKMSQAMTKLHEEGNVTTRFTQDLALKMMEGMPKAKLETRVITDGSNKEK